jgi:tetratricopeptide (TPR) repeat protein
LNGKIGFTRYDKFKGEEMMRRKYFIVFGIVLLIFTKVSGQEPSQLDCRFYNLYLSGNMNMWDSVVDSLYLERLTPAQEETLMLAEYGLIGYHLSQGDKDEASGVMEHFERRLEKWLKRNPENATFHALNAALTGFKIGLNPLIAPFVNSEHKEQIANALKYRAGNPLPLIEKANSLYFRPSIVGGDKKEAKKAYEQAFSILRNDKQCNWLYLHVGSWLGQVYTKMDEPRKAKQLYLELLDAAPDFQYVKEELLPQLENGGFIDITNRLEKEYSRD